MSPAVLLTLLACTPTPGDPPAPLRPPGADAEATSYATRGAPTSVSDWAGPWTARVLADPPDRPGALALAEGLGLQVEPWDGGRPAVGAGQLALVWVGPERPPSELRGRLAPPPGPPGSAVGAVVAVLDPGGPEDWRRAAAAELPWADLGVIDPVRSGALLGAPAPSLGAAGGVVALVAAEAYGLDLRPLAVQAPPGLAQRLGGVEAEAAAHPDPRVRAEVARRLAPAALAEDPEAAVRVALARGAEDPALLARLARDPEPLVRARAADRLRDPAALAPLVDDPSSVVRLVATHSLATLAHQGHADPRVPEALLAAARSPDAYQRWKAAWGLGPLPQGRETLLAMLQDPDIDVRREAASALGRHPAPEVVEALTRALDDTNSFVRRWAVRGLGELGDPAAVPALERALADPTRLVAREAARALQRMGRPARAPDFLPPTPPRSEDELRALVEHADATTRKDACKLLAARPGAGPWLERLARDADSEVRKAAVEAMSYVPELGPGLNAFLDDPDPDTRVAALEGLRRLGVGDPERLARALDEPDAELGLRAAEALSALARSRPLPPGPAARLRALLDHPDERVRAAAVRAFPEGLRPDEPALLVLQAAGVPGHAQAAVRWAAPGASPEEAAWARGLLALEDELVHLRFSWNDPADRPMSHRLPRPPVPREYGHPNRG